MSDPAQESFPPDARLHRRFGRLVFPVGFLFTLFAVATLLLGFGRDVQLFIVTVLLGVWLFLFWQAHLSGRARKLRPTGLLVTRWGFVFTFTIVSLGVSAFNTSVNLLYVLFAALAGMFILGLPLMFINMVGLRVQRKAPAAAVDGEDLVVALAFRRRWRLPGSFGLVVSDLASPPGALQIPQLRLLRVGSRGSEDVEYTVSNPRRGIYRWQAVRVTSAFPLGVTSLCRDLHAGGRLVVYPRLGAIRRPLFNEGDFGERRTERRSAIRDPLSEFRTLREYRSGDNPRLIHWKTSARQRKLFVREFEPRSRPDIFLLVDTWLPERPSPVELERLETAVSFAATAARDLCRSGHHVALAFFGQELVFVSPGSGTAHFFRLLEALAGLNPCREHSLVDLLNSPVVPRIQSERIVVVTPGCSGSLEQVRELVNSRNGVLVNTSDSRFGAVFSMQRSGPAQQSIGPAEAEFALAGAGDREL